MTETLLVRPLAAAGRLVQAFGVSPSCVQIVSEGGVQIWQNREGDVVKVFEAFHPTNTQLALTDVLQTNLTIFVSGISDQGSGVWTYNISWWRKQTPSRCQIPVKIPKALHNDSSVKRETLPQASQSIPLGAPAGGLLCAASLYQGWLHIMAIDTNLATSDEDRVMTVMHNFADGAADQGGFNHNYKELHCVAVKLSQQTPVQIDVQGGPWLLRDLDPTTTLVQHVSPQASSKPSVLVVSSHSIHQLRADTLDNEPLLGFSLAGLPTAVAHLKGALWALADSMAGLSLLDLDHPCSLRRLTANLPLIAAHVMCRVPDSDTHRDDDVVLFLGSRTANSQLVSLPAALLNKQAASPDAQLHPHSSLQPSAAVSVQRPAMIDSVAPIHDAFVFQEPKGCGESRMVLGCGVAPRGSLRLAHLAAKLNPTISGGPCMPGGPKLMAVKAEWRQEHHAYLAFSFPTEGTTSVLDIQGTHFQPIALPGLDPNSPSLMLAALPGGWLVQVTPQEVRVLDQTGLTAAWAAPHTLSMAASCGSLVAAAHGNSVTLVSVEAATGQPSVTQTLHYAHQVSAVALLDTSQVFPMEEQQHWLAVGLWIDNTVLLQCLSGDQASCTLDCSDVGQPRSVLAAELNGTWFLFVGTSQGWVVYHTLIWQSGKLLVGDGCKVHAGVSGTQLSYLPTHGKTPACVYAQSSKALLLRPAASDKASGNKAGSKADLIEGVRVHGGEGVMGGVGVHTPDLPNSIAWLSPKEELTFGDIDHTTQLRWFTLGLDNTPHHVAYHSSSNHAVVLSTSPADASCLRLVHATTLTQVVALQLGEDHTATALCCARLPSSSVTALHNLPGQPPTEKEFVVMASYLASDSGFETGAGPGSPQAFLSVFEVCTSREAGPKGHNPRSKHGCQLKLQGTCQLQSLCYSLATVPAQQDHAAGASKAWSQDCGPQVVLAGCQGEVHMYSIFVDDTAQAGRQAVATARQALSTQEALPDQTDRAAGIGPRESSMAGPSRAASSERLASQGWTGRVRLQLLSKAATAGGSSLITSLSTLGHTAAACSFMSSLSLFTTASPEGQPTLEPLSANISLMEVEGYTQHDAPIQVQSAGILNGHCLLAGAYPDGLVLLRRDVADEELHRDARQRKRDLAQLADTNRGNVETLRNDAAPQSEERDLPNVHLQAGCNIGQGATSFCRGHLGVQPLGHPPSLCDTDEAARQPDHQESEASGNDMLVTTSDGQVFATSLVKDEGQLHQSDAVCQADDPDMTQQFKWSSSLSAEAVVEMLHPVVSDCIRDTSLQAEAT